ncbi:oligosaccharide flippase family protein [Candidatus Bathycorpusculum sp.]|uniref:oligosaccharide flippase family protein n=1 Tax=Candidatus Bathycorpusculum sp. TaxID=2994959 RepID=UPI00283497AE|nr:oligosaccharide flippase family protein [Candidatus Termitimicrobium sp.]MCL2431298.1 oligosaccharide flippase family protein [Candidatus Termitimicrobium sp.]
MAKAIEMGKTSAIGSFHLLLGVAGSTIIMAIGTIALGILLPAEGVGLYGMALIPSAIINFFRDWGVNTAITKQIAGLRGTGRDSEIHDVIVSGIVFEIISGIVLSLICFAIAWPLAYIISPQNAEALSLYIGIMSVSIFAGAIAAASGGVFVGYERMKLNSITQISQAIIKTALGPLLIIIGAGVLGAVVAAMVSMLAGGIIAVLLVYYILFRPLRKSKTGKCDIKQTLKPMLTYGLPLTASTIAAGVLPQVFSFVMAVYAGTWMMGNYFTAVNFSVLLTFVSIPTATALFPVFAKLDPQKEPELLKTVFAFSVKYTALLLVPATMALITLATPLVNTLFPMEGIFQSLLVAGAEPKFPFAPLFLVLSAAVNLFVLFGNVSLGTFLIGIGETRQLMKQSALSLAVGLPLAYFLVEYSFSLGGSNAQLSSAYAVIGGLVGSLIASMPGMIWGLIWSWRKYHVRADFRVSSKIFAASLFASIVSFALISFLNLPYVIILAAGFVVFGLVYLVAAPIFGAVNRMDIENFRAMFSGLGIVSRFLNVPLLFMRKICRGNVEPQVLAPAGSQPDDSQKP